MGRVARLPSRIPRHRRACDAVEHTRHDGCEKTNRSAGASPSLLTSGVELGGRGIRGEERDGRRRRRREASGRGGEGLAGRVLLRFRPARRLDRRLDSVPIAVALALDSRGAQLGRPEAGADGMNGEDSREGP